MIAIGVAVGISSLQQYFDSHVVVDNHAVNGRSTKSFINEGRWDKVLAKIKPGDYVFIQFGHNDEKPQPERHTDPGTTFDDNLRKFVNETRSKGGIPVLFNAVVRRNFALKVQKNDDDEKLRNLDAELQAKIFKTLGFTPERAKEQFGFLMNAFKYGAPPHGGLAYGLDRWVSLFAGLDSIRDCIAFPKNNSGRDVMLDAPSFVDQKQLDELMLDIVKE